MRNTILKLVFSLLTVASNAQTIPEMPPGVILSKEVSAHCAKENGCRIVTESNLRQVLLQVRLQALKEGAEIGYVAGFETGEKKSCRVDTKFVNLNLK